MDQKTEIRSYIKCRIRLNIDSKQIFNELCGIYGPQTISMRTVFRWVKAFKTGKISFEDDTRPGRLKKTVTKANIAAVKIVVEPDVRLSVKDIASCTWISEGSVQTILKKRLDLRKVQTLFGTDALQINKFRIFLKYNATYKVFMNHKRPTCWLMASTYGLRHAKTCFWIYADSEDTDQPAQPYSLIRTLMSANRIFGYLILRLAN